MRERGKLRGKRVMHAMKVDRLRKIRVIGEGCFMLPD